MPRESVRVIPIICNQYFLLSQDHCDGNSIAYGGGIEEGETIEQAFIREFQEETGGYFDEPSTLPEFTKNIRKVESKTQNEEFIDYLTIVHIDDMDLPDKINALLEDRWNHEDMEFHHNERSGFHLVDMYEMFFDIQHTDTWAQKYKFEWNIRYLLFKELWELLGVKILIRPPKEYKISDLERYKYFKKVYNRFGVHIKLYIKYRLKVGKKFSKYTKKLLKKSPGEFSDKILAQIEEFEAYVVQANNGDLSVLPKIGDHLICNREFEIGNLCKFLSKSGYINRKNLSLYAGIENFSWRDGAIILVGNINPSLMGHSSGSIKICVNEEI